jgi:hypothetical protein
MLFPSAKLSHSSTLRLHENIQSSLQVDSVGNSNSLLWLFSLIPSVGEMETGLWWGLVCRTFSLPL